jgi:hypothetical protein
VDAVARDTARLFANNCNIPGKRKGKAEGKDGKR